MTNKDLLVLEKLQEIDCKVDEEAQKLKEIPARVNELREDVNRVRELLNRERERLTELEKWRTDHERDVTLQTELLAKSKNKQAQGRNERELKAAQREIETIRKAMQDREGEILEVMEAIEQFKKAIAEHEKEFGDLELHLRAEEKEAEQRMAEVEQLIATKRGGRESVLREIPKPILSIYERIRRRGGLVLVEVKDDHCSGCNMQVEPQRLIELHKGDKIIQCQWCHSILYFKGEQTCTAL